MPTTKRPICKYCHKRDGVLVQEASHKAGIARGSTRYQMVPYWHHQSCNDAFEVANAESQARHQAELEEIRQSLLVQLQGKD